MRVVSSVALLLAVAGQLPAAEPVECEDVRCAVQGTIEQRCPCSAAASHGAQVRCVAGVVKELAAAGAIPARCKGTVRRCASRSTCGRPGAVACDVARLVGTCAIGLGFCRHPDGSILHSLPCSSDADCVLESRCHVEASAERCAARGGTVAARESCCTQCPPGGATPCGPGLTCGASEVCVIFGPFGPGGFSQTCHPVPAECDLDRTCGCLADELCTSPHVCHDVERPGSVIFCECTACV
jgi:hypothetical protein